MKFLVTIDDTHQSVETAFVNLDAQQRWAEKHVGKQVESIYSLAGGHGAIMIVDVNSHEELDELMIESRACNGADIKIYPLADYRAGLKNLETQLGRMVAQLRAAD